MGSRVAIDQQASATSCVHWKRTVPYSNVVQRTAQTICTGYKENIVVLESGYFFDYLCHWNWFLFSLLMFIIFLYFFNSRGRVPLAGNSLRAEKSHSFVYTSGHCRRWRSRMEVKIMAGSLFVHCKIAYFYSVTAEKWLIVSLPNFVTIRSTHFSISCKIFSWIRSTKLKIHAMEFCDFIKDSVSPSGLFVPCSLTVTSTWRPRLTAHCPIGERH